MTVYSIFEKPQAGASKNRVPEQVPPVAVPDRFSLFAAVLPPLFALAHGLWLLLVFWVALVMGLAYVSRVIGTDAATLIYLLVSLFLGFEAAALRRDALEARGWRWRGDIIAAARDLAERDFLLRK